MEFKPHSKELIIKEKIFVNVPNISNTTDMKDVKEFLNQPKKNQPKKNQLQKRPVKSTLKKNIPAHHHQIHVSKANKLMLIGLHTNANAPLNSNIIKRKDVKESVP